MAECHSCPHKQIPGLVDMPWEQTPCSRCDLSAPSNKGRCHISLDADPSAFWGEGAKEAEINDNAATLTCNEMKEGLRVILDLMRSNPVTAKIIIFRIVHPYKLKEIADAEGLTMQAARDRILKALKKWPELAAFISMREYNKRK